MVLRRLPLLRRAELHRRHVREPPARRAAVLRQRRPAVRTATRITRRRWCPTRRISTSPAVGGDTWTRGETLNLTWQATPEEQDHHVRPLQPAPGRLQQCSATTSPEAGVYFTHRPEYILQSDLEQSVHEQAALRRRLHVLQRALDLRSASPTTSNGYGPDAVVSKTESSLGSHLRRRATCSRPPATTSTTCAPRSTTSPAATPSSSACRTCGARATTRYDTNQAQAWTLHPRHSRPRSRSTRGRSIDLEHLKAALGVYAQDRWTINRLTLNYGLRFDYHNAYVPAQDAGGDHVRRARGTTTRSTTCRTGRISRRASAPPTTSSATARPCCAATTASTWRANRPTWRR